MSFRLIGIDVDGTLLNSHHELPPRNAEALLAASQRGIEIVLVTGRRFDFVLPIARQIPCPLTLIVNNGALIKSKDGATHVRHLLPVVTARAVLAATLPFRRGAAVVFDRPRENQVIWEVIDWNDAGRRSYFERNREFIAQMRLEDSLTEDPIQVMFTGGVSAMREVASVLRSMPEVREFALAYTEYEARDFALVDVINAVCSKGAALAEWTRLRGLPREEVMAIGDNHNDLEMLEFAGLAVVMANSVPGLRRDGWRVTSSNDEDGVAAAIHDIVLRDPAD
jgi:Cof subfamily protein (haloacid dehalogenase superfamily)